MYCSFESRNWKNIASIAATARAKVHPRAAENCTLWWFCIISFQPEGTLIRETIFARMNITRPSDTEIHFELRSTFHSLNDDPRRNERNILFGRRIFISFLRPIRISVCHSCQWWTTFEEYRRYTGLCRTIYRSVSNVQALNLIYRRLTLIFRSSVWIGLNSITLHMYLLRGIVFLKTNLEKEPERTLRSRQLLLKLLPTLIWYWESMH